MTASLRAAGWKLCEYTPPARLTDDCDIPTEFFRKATADGVALGLLTTAESTLRAAPMGLPIGSQTYPHRALIKDGNFAALAATLAGIQQGLHNEGFESSEVDGRRTYDVLFERLDPSLVKFQFQMSTISRGFVAHEYFTKYPGRFISMHLQDVALNATPPPPAEGQPVRRGRGVQTALGKGSIDWVRTFQAAKIAGVKNYYVEQNMDLTLDSVAFLKTLTV